MGYTKLFTEIIMSTIWREKNHVRLTWITMLAMKDRWHVVNASIPGLADSARVTMDECVEALRVLSSPDKYSRTTQHEGRRIEACDGGWVILNGEKYRNKMSLDERREYQRIKQAEYRAKKKQTVKSCLQKSQQFTHTDTDTDTDIKKNKQKKINKKKESVENVFEHWKYRMNHKRSQLDAKRIKIITNALGSGYEEKDLIIAVDGCSRTPHNMGKNENGQVYDGLHIILKNADQIDRFMHNNEFPPKENNYGKNVQESKGRAKKFADTLNDIAREDIEKNGYTDFVD